MIPRDIPSLRVICHGGQLWTLDNKLLYIYRISPQVKRVSVVHVSNGQRFLDKFLAENSKVDIDRMASADFFPRVDNSANIESPSAELFSCRPGRVRLSTMKRLEKDKIRGKRSSAHKSSSSASSSRTVTSRISAGNAEAGTPSGSVGSKCAHSDSKMSTGTCSLSLGSKSVNSDNKLSGSRRSSSSTESSTSEDTVGTKTPRYPAVRSMTGHPLHSQESLLISSAEGNDNACSRRRRFSFPSFAERPSTCHAYSKFSCSRFPSASRATRLVQEKTSSEFFTRIDPRSSETALSINRLSTEKPSAGHDCLEHFYHSRFSAAFLDGARGNACRRVSAKCPGNNSQENHVPQSFSAKFQDDAQKNVSQCFSAKCHEDSRETVSQSFSSKVEIGEYEPEDDFELEAFVLPNFCYSVPKVGDIKLVDDQVSSPSSPRTINGSPISTSQDRLDRSVSSCSSSTERPMKKPHRGEPQRSGSGSEGGPGRTPPRLTRSGIGRPGSPLRRACVSAGRTMKCHLSAEHEFEVSKQILLKHMKKAFFSVC